MVREYITTCGQDLAIFLKEWVPKDTKEMIRLAEQYTEARDNGATNTQNMAAAVHPVMAAYKPVHGDRQCYICHRTNIILQEIAITENKTRGTSIIQERNIIIATKQVP